MNFLTAKLGGLPAWAWGAAVIGGGLALWWFIRRQGGTVAGPQGQQQQVDTSQLDPNTGVPYQIESATNPATGLPAYYGGPGVDQPTQASAPPAPGPTSSTPLSAPTAAPAVAATQASAPKATTQTSVRRRTTRRRRAGPRTLASTSGRPGDGPDDSGSGDGPDEGSGSGPSCPLGLGCGASGCRGLCQGQATPHWPVMTDVSGGRY